MWIYDDIERIRRKMEKIMEKIMEEIEKPMWDYRTKCLEPLVTITDKEEEIVVKVDLPCVRKEEIKLTATEKTLTIEATLKEAYKMMRLTTTRETRFEHFKKTIKLPSEVQPEKARAKFKNGILEIRLPKKIGGREIKIE